MEQQIVRDQGTTANHQTNFDQEATHEKQPIPDKQIAVKEYTALEEEPKSDQDTFPDQQITPESNEAYLRQHQSHLRSSYASGDLSEASYHTEQTLFPGSRHSSINTEPLTLDADQIHEAKDQAVDVLQKVDSDAAFDIFTKDADVEISEALSPESEAQALADQISTLVEKAQQVVEANEQQQSQLANKTSGLPSASLVEDMKAQENPAASLEDDTKTKND